MSGDPERVASPSQTAGPFLHIGLPTRADGRMADRFPDADPLILRIRVTDGDDRAVDDALVELMQAAPVTPGTAESPAALFGRATTDGAGWCEFVSARPAAVADGADGFHAAHINAFVFARGLLRHLQTRIYFAGDAALEQDAVLGLIPADRRATLFATPDHSRAGVWEFQVRLQGAGETVFFDA